MFLFLAACSEYDLNGEEPDKDPGLDSAGAPAILVDPLELDFGDVPLGAASDPRVVTITNVGDADLFLQGVEVEGADFTTTALGEPVLAAGASETFAVTFAPGAIGVRSGVATVSSNAPDSPTVDVALLGQALAPDIVVDPVLHDFGTLDQGSSAFVDITVRNDGGADLLVSGVEWLPGTPEMVLSAGDLGSFTLAAGESRVYTVTYTPTDDNADEAFLSFASNDADTPVATSNEIGNGRIFEGFSTGWYIVDDSTNYETTSNPSYTIESYGDSDGYWYEPSGAHGLVGSADPVGDFAILRDYVIARAPGPVTITGPLTFVSTSSVPAFTYASYSYIVCDFWIDSTDDPALYEVTTGTVDDGLRVMVNGVVLGDIVLGGSGAFSLQDVAVPGAVNTLAVILMDNSAVDKYVYDLAFYRDGVIVSD